MGKQKDSMDDSSKCFLARVFECVKRETPHFEKQKLPCPSKKKSESGIGIERVEKDGCANVTAGEENLKDRCSSSTCADKNSYLSPDHICPVQPSPPCCYIKMQDPCALCCCEPEPPPSPCPSKCCPQERRKLTCGCDLCTKGCDGNKCYNQNEPI